MRLVGLGTPVRGVEAGGDSYSARTLPIYNWDFEIGSGLIADDTWRELDFASIVPVGAASKLIHLRCYVVDNALGSVLWLRPIGAENNYIIAQIATLVAGFEMYMEAWIVLNANRKIEYYMNTGVDAAAIAVAGWMT